jgi:hypothetical protein
MRRRAAVWALGAAAAAALALKLFTAEVTYRDDSTVALAVRAVPSLRSAVQGGPPAGYTVVAGDEFGFPGYTPWRWITGAGWLLLGAAWLGAAGRPRGARAR